MTRIALKITYDGSAYNGWQRQPNKKTIQQTIEMAIEKATGEKVKLIGSGRTDAGVHALGQIAHFDTESNIKPSKFYKAVNFYLAEEKIKVVESKQVDNTFHAINSAKKKNYCYRLYLSEVELPLIDGQAVMTYKDLSIEKLKECANFFIGEHDFKCFNASKGGAKTTVRTIYSIEFKVVDKVVEIYFTGNGFLYNMVRTMVGTMVDYATGLISKETIDKMLRTGDRALSGKTLSAKGLTLVSVEY